MTTTELIDREIEVLKRQLKERNDDLNKAIARTNELEGSIERINKKIADFEKDKEAMTRGYVAFMGDAAAKGAA